VHHSGDRRGLHSTRVEVVVSYPAVSPCVPSWGSAARRRATHGYDMTWCRSYTSCITAAIGEDCIAPGLKWWCLTPRSLRVCPPGAGAARRGDGPRHCWGCWGGTWATPAPSGAPSGWWAAWGRRSFGWPLHRSRTCGTSVCQSTDSVGGTLVGVLYTIVKSARGLVGRVGGGLLRVAVTPKSTCRTVLYTSPVVEALVSLVRTATGQLLRGPHGRGIPWVPHCTSNRT
jgi:hypothetical protein